MNRIIAINKAKGPTSHDVVDELRKITGVRKIGHAGTLDPLAEGVLVVAIGRENTKKISEIVKKEKEYLAQILLGENSQTDDAEGEKTSVSSRVPKLEEINRATSKFIGQIEQIPPIYSAIKIKGKSAYKYARAGQEIELKPRMVEIKDIKILDYRYPILKLAVTTGSGVYIRSLARDIGSILKTGAYLYSLQRIRVGEFTLGEALTIEQFRKNIEEETHD